MPTVDNWRALVAEPEAWMLEFGAVGFPVGHPSRVTVKRFHQDREAADAEAKATEFNSRVVPLVEAGPLAARIAELEAERNRLRATVVTARDGYISERATGKPVLESWRERTLEMLDKALGDNT